MFALGVRNRKRKRSVLNMCQFQHSVGYKLLEFYIKETFYTKSNILSHSKSVKVNALCVRYSVIGGDLHVDIGFIVGCFTWFRLLYLIVIICCLCNYCILVFKFWTVAKFKFTSSFNALQYSCDQAKEQDH